MKSKKGLIPILRWLFVALGSNKKWILLVSVTRMLEGVEGTLFAIEMRSVIDCAVAKQFDLFLRHAGILLALVVSAVLLHLMGWYYEQRSSALVEKGLRMHVFSQLLQRSYADVSVVHSGEWMTRIASDTRIICNILLQVLPNLGGMVLQVGSAYLSLFFILPQVAYVLLPAGLLLMVLAVLLQRKLKDAWREVMKADGAARSFMQERLTSLSVVHTFGQEARTARQAEERLDELVRVKMRRSKLAAMCNLGSYGVMRGGYLLGVILCGFQILNARMSYGTMVTVLQLVSRIDGPVAEMSDYVLRFFNVFASVERLMEIEEYDLDCLEPPKEPAEIQTYYNDSFDAIGIRGGYFAYSDGEDGNTVIKDFNIEIHKGEYVAFTGESGCGKSTVLKLFMSLYRLLDGEIYLKDADGQEHPLDAAWRGLFAYVPQGNDLLSGTIREVLTFGSQIHMERKDDLYHALRVACAEKFVRELPNGLDTILGEHGAGLSEGQMQRIAIARAVLSGRPILMLDESTSALDEGTELELLANLQTMTNRTVILITHRSAALHICGKQVKFEQEA